MENIDQQDKYEIAAHTIKNYGFNYNILNDDYIPVIRGGLKIAIEQSKPNDIFIFITSIPEKFWTNELLHDAYNKCLGDRKTCYDIITNISQDWKIILPTDIPRYQIVFNIIKVHPDLKKRVFGYTTFSSNKNFVKLLLDNVYDNNEDIYNRLDMARCLLGITNQVTKRLLRKGTKQFNNLIDFFIQNSDENSDIVSLAKQDFVLSKNQYNIILDKVISSNSYILAGSILNWLLIGVEKSKLISEDDRRKLTYIFVSDEENTSCKSSVIRHKITSEIKDGKEYYLKILNEILKNNNIIIDSAGLWNIIRNVKKEEIMPLSDEAKNNFYKSIISNGENEVKYPSYSPENKFIEVIEKGLIEKNNKYYSDIMLLAIATTLSITNNKKQYLRILNIVDDINYLGKSNYIYIIKSLFNLK